MLGNGCCSLKMTAAAREMLKATLAGDPYTIVEANNGAEALGLFRNGGFDLVMTDFEIPFLKGNELAAGINQCPPGSPFS